jgi:RNA recognition motif-containing protein
VPTNEKGRPKGFGFLLFDDEHTVSTVLEYMQGADIDDRAIRLERVAEENNGHGQHHEKERSTPTTSSSSSREGWTKAKSDRNHGFASHHHKASQNGQSKPKNVPQAQKQDQNRAAKPTKKKSENPFDLLTNED